MSPTPDYFELFQLAPRYDLDLAALAERYRDLQRVYHPDRHAGRSPQEVRLAVQKASWVNQAYDVLKSPVARAQYLLALRGIDAAGHSHITSDTAFLMRQMTLRERLQEVEDESDPFAALSDLAEEARKQFAALETAFATALEGDEMVQAAETVAKMQFFAKFLHDIDEVEARLDA